MKNIFRIILVLLGMLFYLNIYAWNALGHMVIANIAYARLNPSIKIKVDKMVADFNKEYPDINYFTQLAPWPDSLRSQKIELFTHWHYADLAFSDDGSPLKNLMDTDNVIWAINKIKPILKNSKANPYERARNLAFLIHIIGDIHQPLHTASRISAANPEGDKGGNLYLIKYPTQNQTLTLHRLWDQGIDLFNVPVSLLTINRLTDMIISHYPDDYFGAKINDLYPETWGNEGFTLATTFLYHTPEQAVPNSHYLDLSREIVKQRVALAGYRLAEILNVWLENSP